MGREFEQELLEKIKSLVADAKYRVRIHAVRHMIEEGFTENDMVTALTGKSKILELYIDEHRCLILGSFKISETVRSPLHLAAIIRAMMYWILSPPIFPRNLGGATPRKGDNNDEKRNEQHN